MKRLILRILTIIYDKIPPRFRNKVEQMILRLDGGYMYSPEIRYIYKNHYGISIGYGSYGGCFDKENIPAKTEFGNYCSISKNIRIFRANHPLQCFTTHPLLYNPIAGYVIKDMLERSKLIVGNDVWIGEWAIILPNVKSIGNGAIIGAGAIVTKDVKPYTIVAGNPAKEIGIRFNAIQISKIEASKWWELTKEELVKRIDVLNSEIENNN